MTHTKKSFYLRIYFIFKENYYNIFTIHDSLHTLEGYFHNNYLVFVLI